MKKHYYIPVSLAVILTVSSCGIFGGGINSQALGYAAANAITAASISDEQIAELSARSVAEMDAQNRINDGEYAERLSRLTKDVSVPGLNLNFKVYETSEINAFACGDGSIRVYSALMDVMDDDELMAIIGHEIGHVVHKDTKKAMQRAYLGCAARNALISAGGPIALISASAIGEIADTYLGAQFSQKQEYRADEYGYDFALKYGQSPYSMAKALEKLVKMSNGSATASAVAKMFSTHPDSEKRAAKVRAKADAYVEKHK